MNMLTDLKQKKPTPPQVLRPSALAAMGERQRLSDELVMVSDSRGARAEAIRALRTHIIAQHINGGRRALAVCGASAGVGCTFVAANLAVALAQVEIKTLLIDGDLREPSVQQFISPTSPGVGLAQCLSSHEVAFGDALDTDVLPYLSVLQAGGPATNPQELLAGERFETLMGVCLRDFDITIVDTPPANSCADARRISNVLGYSLVVARSNTSLVGDIKTLVDELQGDHAQVVGTILNEA